MEPEEIAGSFAEFLEKEFARNAAAPYDYTVPSIVKRFGVMPLDKHVTYSPSSLLSGDEDISNTVLLPAQMSLIFNGDLYTQLITEAKSGQPDQITTYLDDLGRTRLKVI